MTAIAPHITAFLREYLPLQRGASRYKGIEPDFSLVHLFGDLGKNTQYVFCVVFIWRLYLVVRS